jgi:protein prenyltransferase alpha subunit repeat containing protein 1
MDGHLGVPQKSLYRAYMDAVQRFTAARRSASIGSAAVLVSSSAVILLANPAHATALNSRKRLILQKTLNCDQELKFIELLVAGVKDAAKQDGLWHHRRWLLHRLYPAACPFICFVAPPQEVWNNELNLITRACELYPRNYHGWTHRTLCMQSAAASDSGFQIVREDMAFTSQWIERHVSDASAAHHLCTLTGYMEQHSSDPRHNEEFQKRDEIVTHALGLVGTYPDHEALWAYLRAALALLPTSQITAARMEVTSALSKVDLTSNPSVRRNSELFFKWDARTTRTATSVLTEDIS